MKQFIAAGKFTKDELRDKAEQVTRRYNTGFDNRNINLRHIFRDMVGKGRGKNLPYNLIASGSFSWATPEVSCAIPREFNIKTCYQTVRDTTVMLCCYWSLDMPTYLYLFLDKHGDFMSFLPCLGNSIMMDPVNNNKFYMPLKTRYYALPDWAHKLGFIQDMIEHREPEGKMIAAINLYVRHIVQAADPDIMAADLRQNLRVFDGKLKPVEEIYPYDKYLIDNLNRYKYDPRDKVEELAKETLTNSGKKYPLIFLSESRRIADPENYIEEQNSSDMDFGMPSVTSGEDELDRVLNNAIHDRIEDIIEERRRASADSHRIRDYDGDSITQEQLDLLLGGMF